MKQLRFGPSSRLWCAFLLALLPLSVIFLRDTGWILLLPRETGVEFFNGNWVVQHHVSKLDQWTISTNSWGDRSESVVICLGFQPSRFHWAGVRFEGWRLSVPMRGYPAGTWVSWEVSLNMWLATVIASIPLAWYGVVCLRRSYRGSKPGTCSRCGYDLRATPDRCPECGK